MRAYRKVGMNLHHQNVIDGDFADLLPVLAKVANFSDEERSELMAVIYNHFEEVYKSARADLKADRVGAKILASNPRAIKLKYNKKSSYIRVSACGSDDWRMPWAMNGTHRRFTDGTGEIIDEAGLYRGYQTGHNVLEPYMAGSSKIVEDTQNKIMQIIDDSNVSERDRRRVEDWFRRFRKKSI